MLRFPYPPSRSVLSGFFLSSLVLLGLQTGCTNARDIPWYKIGASDQQRITDYDQCQSETRHDTQRSYGVETDIAAVHGTDWRNAGVYNQQNSNLTQGTAEQTNYMIASCMGFRGYRRVTN